MGLKLARSQIGPPRPRWGSLWVRRPLLAAALDWAGLLITKAPPQQAPDWGRVHGNGGWLRAGGKGGVPSSLLVLTLPALTEWLSFAPVSPVPHSSLSALSSLPLLPTPCSPLSPVLSSSLLSPPSCSFFLPALSSLLLLPTPCSSLPLSLHLCSPLPPARFSSPLLLPSYSPQFSAPPSSLLLPPSYSSLSLLLPSLLLFIFLSWLWLPVPSLGRVLTVKQMVPVLRLPSWGPLVVSLADPAQGEGPARARCGEGFSPDLGTGEQGAAGSQVGS